MKKLTIEQQNEAIDTVIEIAGRGINDEHECNKYFDINKYPVEENEEKLDAITPLLKAVPELLENLKNMLFCFSSSAESKMQKAAIKYATELLDKIK